MRDELVRNVSSALSLLAGKIDNVAQQREDYADLDEYPVFIDNLMGYFPLDKVDEEAGTYDQYLFDLQKTVIDNYYSGNYQVAYFYAHLIFMSYVYYSIELAYSIWPDKVKDQYDLLNAYGTRDKPNLQNHASTYAFSKIPEKEIFKVFYAIGMDVQYIQQLSKYVEKRDDYAHATGEGNINIEAFEGNIRTISQNMDRIHALFTPILKSAYVSFLTDSIELSYAELKERIEEFIFDHGYSLKDLTFLCNLGISNIRNENEKVKTHYRCVRRTHCAFIDYCMENENIDEPEGFSALYDDAYIYYQYQGNAEEYVEKELGLSVHHSASREGDHLIYPCPECSKEQLALDAVKGIFRCFSCGKVYTSQDLTFCTECGRLMKRDESSPVCHDCIEKQQNDKT